MKAVFADTAYFLALLNTSDDWHEQATEISEARDFPLLTTSWVLTELANAMSKSRYRAAFLYILDEVEEDPDAIVVEAEQTLWNKGRALFAARPDKDWSLTDCISFVVMEERGLTDALTSDHHFEQAGFNILLK